MALLQGLDRMGLLGLSAQFPVIRKIVFVQAVPLQNVFQRTWWEFAFNNATLKFYRDLKVAIFGVKVGWCMVISVHGDDDA
jgi:hypothetical protein